MLGYKSNMAQGSPFSCTMYQNFNPTQRNSLQQVECIVLFHDLV